LLASLKRILRQAEADVRAGVSKQKARIGWQAAYVDVPIRLINNTAELMRRE
jgi:hypothetical protein